MTKLKGLAMTDTPADKPLELAIADVDPTASIEHVARTLDRLEAYLAYGRELKSKLEANLLIYVTANAGENEIMIGTVKYWLGYPKVTKCTNVRGCAEALLESSGGDWDAFANCLAADGVKPGAAKKILGDRWDEFFTVEVRPKLENDAPKKTLQRLDTKYLK
jgi:hypothetical protein